MLCRGCCCGTSAKHPRTDHEAQVFALEEAAASHPGVEVRLVDCLDVCDRSNVALVRRPRAPKGKRDTWLGGLLTDSATRALADWVHEGAPDGDVPPRIEALTFTHRPPRKKR